jgi:hypothetical protein
MPDVWADETPLYIWSQQKADLTPVKAAKAVLERIDGEIGRVIPIAVKSLSDLPDLDARVLAIGSRPPFICNYALVGERTSEEGFVRALRWIFRGPGWDDPKATTLDDILTAAFPPDPGTGAMPQMVPVEELEAERRLRIFGDEPAASPIRRDPVVTVSTPEQNAKWAMMAHRAGEDLSDDDAELVRTVTITEPGHEVTPAEVLGGGASLAKRAAAAGWRVHATRSGTHVGAVLFKNDSPEDAKDAHRAGDVRYPAEDRLHFQVAAELVAEGRVLAKFRLVYQSRPSAAKSGYSTAFTYGQYDDFGEVVTILPGATLSALSEAADRSRLDSIAEFTAWFDVLVPPKTPKKKKDTRTPEERMLSGEEWQA